MGEQAAAGAVSQTLVRFGYLCFVGLAATLLSWVQHERVLRISGLLKDRSSLLADAMAAEERERGSLAETLHDGVLQNVLAIRHLVQEAAEQDGSAGECLQQADRELGTVAEQLRSTVFDLHPAVLEEAGLPVALSALAERSAARGGFTVTTDLRTDVPAAHRQLLYSAARELLTNVVRHARAERVDVALLADPDWITLTVCDDGDGLDPTALWERVRAGHIGLASYQVRVESAGGTFTIGPALPRGTRVAVTLPVPLPAPPTTRGDGGSDGVSGSDGRSDDG
jgi:two-component system NarL family sensor kinase